MKESPKLEWVHNHQDNDPNVETTKLSDAIKLNIKANVLATQGLDKLESNPQVRMDPSAEVLIHQWG